jgi:hypothetical protein
MLPDVESFFSGPDSMIAISSPFMSEITIMSEKDVAVGDPKVAGIILTVEVDEYLKSMSMIAGIIASPSHSNDPCLILFGVMDNSIQIVDGVLFDVLHNTNIVDTV